MERGLKLREIEPDERFDALDPLVWRKVELVDYWKMEEEIGRASCRERV